MSQTILFTSTPVLLTSLPLGGSVLFMPFWIFPFLCRIFLFFWSASHGAGQRDYSVSLDRNSPVPPTKGPKQYFLPPRQWGAPFSYFGDNLQVNCNFSIIYAFLDFSLFGITSYKENFDIINFVQNMPLFWSYPFYYVVKSLPRFPFLALFPSHSAGQRDY